MGYPDSVLTGTLLENHSVIFFIGQRETTIQRSTLPFPCVSNVFARP